MGVGRVTEKRQRTTEFEVDFDEGRRPVLEVLMNAEEYRQHEDDPDKVEYFVRIHWTDTKPEPQAVYEVGFFRESEHRVPSPSAKGGDKPSIA